MMDWQPRRQIEINYQQALIRLWARFGNVMNVITDPLAVRGELSRFVATKYFQEFAMAAASRMVTQLAVSGAKTWKEAARESGQGQMIYNMLKKELQGPVGYTVQSLVDRNAELISTFPQSVGREVATFIKDETLKGRRSEYIMQDLREQFPHIAESRMKLIARTEASKASTALTRARSLVLGADWFQWQTSHDARVRDSHRLMAGVLCSWHDLPSPELLDGLKSVGQYAPGGTFNCRCYPAPMLNLAMIEWPAKVYTAGRIVRMTRVQFEQMTGIERRAA